MKKRKKPVVLTTVLVLMVSAVAIQNFPKDLMPKPSGKAPETGKTDVEVPDKDTIAKDVASSMGASPKPGTKQAMMQKMGGGGPSPMGEEGNSGPAIALRKSTPYRPTPTETSTSTQWYSNETLKEIPKKK